MWGDELTTRPWAWAIAEILIGQIRTRRQIVTANARRAVWRWCFRLFLTSRWLLWADDWEIFASAEIWGKKINERKISNFTHYFFIFAPSHLNRSKISLRSTHRIIISRWQQQRRSISTQFLLQLGRKRIKELHMSLVNERRWMLLHILTTALGFSTRSRIAAQRRLESSLDDIDFHVAAVRRRGALNWHIDGPRRRLLKSAHRERGKDG